LVEIPLEESKISHPEMLVEPRLDTQFNEALLPQQLGFDF